MDLNTRIQQREGVIHTEVNGEMVLMHVERGFYFSLNEVGAFIWKNIVKAESLAGLCSLVQQEFDVAEDQCREDILALAEKLGEEGLVDTLA